MIFFFIKLDKSKKKFQIKVIFPILKNIIYVICKIETKTIFKDWFFLSSEEYIKGDIIEKTFNEILENILSRKYREKFQSILINRILENKITDFYSMKQAKDMLKRKYLYQEIKTKYKNYNLENKYILFIKNKMQNIMIHVVNFVKN